MTKKVRAVIDEEKTMHEEAKAKKKEALAAKKARA